jgi:hypothetical protein
MTKKDQYVEQIGAADIAEPEHPIHPALDWVNGQLIVGVMGKKGQRALLSSSGRYANRQSLGMICAKGAEFPSFVTSAAVKAFLEPSKGNSAVTENTLKRLRDCLKKFVSFPSDWTGDVVAAWILATYVYPIFQAFPYMRITSASPGSGKSVLGQTIARLSFNGEFMTSPGEAHLFRMAEMSRGVQVWDEMEIENDIEKKKFAGIKGILLNGYRNGGVVPRTEGRNWERVEIFHVYCPRVLIGLSDLPEVVLQRVITITMQKRTAEAEVEIYNPEAHQQAEQSLRDGCVLWALQNASAVSQAYYSSDLRKTVEGCLGDVGRQADDIWLPLFAVVQSACADPEERERWFNALKTGALSHRTVLRGDSVSAAKLQTQKIKASPAHSVGENDDVVIARALEKTGVIITNPEPTADRDRECNGDLSIVVALKRSTKPVWK